MARRATTQRLSLYLVLSRPPPPRTCVRVLYKRRRRWSTQHYTLVGKAKHGHGGPGAQGGGGGDVPGGDGDAGGAGGADVTEQQPWEEGGTRERLGGNKGGEAFWMEAKACSIYGASYSCWVGRGQ